MRLPIQKALLYPNMEPFVMDNELDLVKLGKLTFESPDLDTFNCLALAYQALEAKGPMTTIFNVANEVAVALFLKEKISFLQIADLISESMDRFAAESCKSIEEILHINDTVREYLRGKYDF
jgi:1-deoxy-D-xylulose-5-phosphate reductoisomerase